MKIFIPSKGRAKTISTPLILSTIPYTVILHTKEEEAEYIKQNPYLEGKTITSGVTGGISEQRQWIKDNLVESGEWFCMMDDNIESFNIYPPEHYFQDYIDTQNNKHLRRTLEDYRANPAELMKVLLEAQNKSEEIGAAYAGFAVVHNYYFRAKKWRTVGYVISKVAVLKKDDIAYDTNIKAMDDYAYTAENLLKYGKVLINNYMFPVAGHYESGGIGTYSERLEKKIADSEYLMQKYPNLFRYKVKKGCHPKAEIQVRFTSEKQVLNWRESYGK
jgi:hypothetical protein